MTNDVKSPDFSREDELNKASLRRNLLKINLKTTKDELSLFRGFSGQ
jgi:hypothetical protein